MASPSPLPSSPMPPPQAPSPMGPPQQSPSPMPSSGAPSPMGPLQHHAPTPGPAYNPSQSPCPPNPALAHSLPPISHIPSNVAGMHMNGPSNLLNHGQSLSHSPYGSGSQLNHQQPLMPGGPPVSGSGIPSMSHSGSQSGPPASQSGPPSAPLGPVQSGQENLNALQRTIDLMEEKGLQEDPRYSQLLVLRAKQGNMDSSRMGFGPSGQNCDGPSKNHLTPNQMLQLRGQIMAYRMLARNQPLSQQVALAVQGKVSSGAQSTTSNFPPSQQPMEAAQTAANRSTGQSDSVIDLAFVNVIKITVLFRIEI